MKISIMRSHRLEDRATLQKVWTAIRTCKSDKSSSELYEESFDKPYADMARLVKACCASGHMSVMEHQSVTFEVEGVSRALLAQFSRHRIGVSLSVQSQRYVDITMENDGVKHLPFVTPVSVESNEKANEIALNILDAVERGCGELSELGIPKEDVRFYYPGGTMTNMTVTVNLRSLADLYKKRVATKGAQWEIKEMVETMANKVTAQLPWYGECLEVM